MTANVFTAIQLARALADDYTNDHMVAAMAELTIGRVACTIIEYNDDGQTALLVRGTDRRQDWGLNLRLRPDLIRGDSGTIYAAGFMEYARVCYGFAKGYLQGGGRIDYIAGHSLGAAAAQIIGASLWIPTHAFASPRPLWSRAQPPGSEKVTSWNAPDDWVSRCPPWGRHVGTVICLELPERLRPLPAHAIQRYVKLLELRRDAA